MASFKDSVKNAGATAGAEKFTRIMNIDDLVIDPEIMRVFIIDEKLLEEISAKMRDGGYDKAWPIIVWLRDGERVIVDGHTRYRAALRAGLKEIPVCEKEFESREDALLYTYRCQKLRRNLTQAEILNVAALLHNKRGRSKEERTVTVEIAKDLGVTRGHMQKTKKVLREGSEDDLALLQKNTPGVTITGVYKKIKKAKAGRAVSVGEESVDDMSGSNKSIDTALPSPAPVRQSGGDAVGGSSPSVDNAPGNAVTADKAAFREGGDMSKVNNIRLFMLIKHLLAVLKSADIAEGGVARQAAQRALKIALGLYLGGKPAGSFKLVREVSWAIEMTKDVEDVSSVEVGDDDNE